MAKLPEVSEYLSAIESPQLLKAPILQQGNVVKRNDTIIRYTGGFCVVFPYETQAKKYAIRCWHASVANAQERTKAIADELHRVRLPYFVGFEYIPQGILTGMGVQPVVAMDWVDAMTLKDYMSANLYNSDKLRSLSKCFLSMVKDLHINSLSHGDLQHGNILVKDSGDIVLVDYDSMCVPSLLGYKEDIKGLEGYQHPARWKNDKLTPKADYFSELIIYTSILAIAKCPKLWIDLNLEDTDTLLFTADDINSYQQAEIYTIIESLDPELKQLSIAIKTALEEDSIDNLKPLEEVIISPVDKISSKWSDNGYHVVKQDTSQIIEGISGKWESKDVIEERSDTNSITSKW